jgi:Arm domain-containing DNA-binding protein
MKLTKASVAKLELPEGKSEIIVCDDDLAGFGVRIRAGGKRTWITQYRIGAKQRRMTLGTLEALGEAEARKYARMALSKAHLGRDPQMEKAEARAQAAVTLGSVVELYLSRAETRLKPRSFLEIRRHLRSHWGPLSQLALANLRRADVATRLASIARNTRNTRSRAIMVWSPPTGRARRCRRCSAGRSATG